MQVFANLPDEAFVRLPAIIGLGGPMPISKSTFWARVADGRLPKPYKLGSQKISAWKVGELRAAFAAFKKEA